MPHRHLIALALFGPTLLASACDPDPCASQETTTAEIGRIEGASTFVPLENGEPVALGFAPQGGLGIFTVLRVTGLDARPVAGLFAKTLVVDVRITGTSATGEPDIYGDFPINATVECVDDSHGLASGVTFGLDPGRFGFGPNPDDPNDPLTAVNGETVTLDVTATDSAGQSASATVDVVMQVNP